MRRTLTLLLLMLMACTALYARDTRTRTVDPAFRSLKVSSADDFYGVPVLRLGSTDGITVSFDEIGDDRSYLRWRLVRCEADWQPSHLVSSQWLDRFNEAEIDDYAFSQNTFVHYVNYRIDLPIDDMVPTMGGNYLLEVFREGEPDDVVVQARIYVEEPLVNVEASADGYTDRGINTEWQKVDVRVDRGRLHDVDPFSDLKVVVQQNASPIDEVMVLHPQRIDGPWVVYEHLPELIFAAGNEYRRFETVRADYPGMHVDSVAYGGSNYHAWLVPDLPRRGREYLYDETQAGRYLVREYNASDSDLGADYVTVHFTLRLPEQPGKDIYADGEFSGSVVDRRYRLDYDPDTQSYRGSIPLKQGSYNYRYLLVDRADGSVDRTFVDGCRPETRNEYFIRIYARDRHNGTDRLVGHTLISL